MSKQAYVFLEEGDVIQEGDEMFCVDKWINLENGFGKIGKHDFPVRRPIATPSADNDDIHVWDMYMRDLLNNVCRERDFINLPTSTHQAVVKQLGSFVDAIMEVRPKHG